MTSTNAKRRFRPNPLTWRRAGAALLALNVGGCSHSSDSDPTLSVNAVADNLSVAWNTAADVDVLANDTASSGALTLTMVSTPAHGTATIANGKVHYVPTAGFFGHDQLTYAATASDGSTWPAQLGLNVEAVLTLSGNVSDGPIANATVTAAVGSKSVAARADGSGNYGLTLRTSEPTDLVVLTATGVGAQGKVKLSSVAGDAAALAALAGSTGKLAATALPALDLTNLSTSLSALVTEVNGGALPATKAQFDSLLASVSLQRAVDLAAAIKLVVDHGVALPAVFADTAALVAKPSASPALDAFLLAQSSGGYPTLLDTARLEVRSTAPSAGTPTIAASAPQTLFYYVGDKLHGVEALVVAYRPGGTARVVTSQGSRDAHWAIASASGQLDVTLDQPFSETQFGADVDPVTGSQYLIRSDTTGFSFRQVAGTSNSGAVRVLKAGATITTGGPTPGTVPFDTSTGDFLKVQDATAAPSGTLALTAADFAPGAVWAGVVPAAFQANLDQMPSTQDLLSVTDGAHASLVHSKTPVAWSLLEGTLQLMEGTAQTRYRRLTTPMATGEEHWLVSVEVGGVSTKVTERLVVKANPGLVFHADSSLFRRWISGIDARQIFTLNADGTGQKIDDGIVQAQHWVLDAATGWLTMATSSRAQRTWQLLRHDGGSILVLERYGFGFTDDVGGWAVNLYADGGAAQ